MARHRIPSVNDALGGEVGDDIDKRSHTQAERCQKVENAVRQNCRSPQLKRTAAPAMSGNIGKLQAVFGRRCGLIKLTKITQPRKEQAALLF